MSVVMSWWCEVTMNVHVCVCLFVAFAVSLTHTQPCVCCARFLFFPTAWCTNKHVGCSRDVSEHSLQHRSPAGLCVALFLCMSHPGDHAVLFPFLFQCATRSLPPEVTHLTCSQQPDSAWLKKVMRTCLCRLSKLSCRFHRNDGLLFLGLTFSFCTVVVLWIRWLINWLVCEQVCLSCCRAGFLYLSFEDAFKSRMNSQWAGNGRQSHGRPKGLLLFDNSPEVVCQCIKVMMHVCLLFMCDTLFRYTLEKLTYLCWLWLCWLYTFACIVCAIKQVVPAYLSWPHYTSSHHTIQYANLMEETLRYETVCCSITYSSWPIIVYLMLYVGCVCVCECNWCLCRSVAASLCQSARGENSMQGMLSLVIISWVTHHRQQ